MRVMVFVKSTERSEAGEMPEQEMIEQMMDFNAELVKAGVMLDGDGLQPSSQGVRVAFLGSEREVIAGPFPAPQELVAGYWLWRVESMEDAIEWVRRMPNPMQEDSVVEIRPLFEPDDFGEEFTPELREKEQQLRAQTAEAEGR